MKRLPLGLRLFLNILVFCIPIIVLTYLMYKSETVNIEFAQKESIGNELQQPYERYMQAVVLTKLSVLFKQPELIPADLSARKDSLVRKMNEHRETLQYTPEGLSTRKREAADLKNVFDLVEQKKFDDAIAALKMGIGQLGDTSNLILDPDLDSYYLMDITLLALPQMQDRVQAILSDRSVLFENGKVNEAQKIKAALYAAMLNESDLQRIIADSQTSLNEDKNFYERNQSLQTNLPLAVNDLKAKAEVFIEILNKISRAENVSEDEFTKAGLSLLAQSYDSWEVSSKELGHLIDHRVGVLSKQRATSLGSAGVALLLAILFSIVVGVSLSQSIRGILDSVLKLKSASESTLEIGMNLSQMSKDVARSVTSQAAAIEETAASIEEINSMVKITSDSSKEAASLADLTNKSAAKGEGALGTMMQSMGDISDSSERIVETMGVIDDIAFQTNLLALNASVEAARAGEQGKGFAVVADAVRALAQKSAVAAKEINDLVKNNVEIIEKGKAGAAQSSEALKEIVSYIKKLNQLIAEIASATNEQGAGLGQVSQAVNDIEIAATQNQTGVDAFKDSAEQLLQESQQLTTIVEILEREVLGGAQT